MNWKNLLAAGAASLALTGTAQATLFDRGGGMIYDSALNITWLQNWNYAKTSGYDADGAMTWDAANAWANNLVYGGYSDWRLPFITDTGTPGCNESYAGGTDCGYNVQTASGSTVFSEMAHLYYMTLGNKAYCNPATSTANNCVVQPGWGLLNTGPFTFTFGQSFFYWSGTEYMPVPGRAWYVHINSGAQFYTDEFIEFSAVAVRPGDVAAVPEPQMLALMLFGLGALTVAARRRAG